ncbi:hypothetical protein EYV94_18450 [Puteibacter caeruleilacunae]|nr:hypothetical protein EYV94_18450 [Puteibacter caeruleilacunae]
MLDGTQHIVFEEYSLSDGMTSLFYFASRELKLYVTGSFEEVEIPLHFTYNPGDKLIRALSIEQGHCGEEIIQKVHQVVMSEEKKYINEKLLKDFIILQKIRL